MKPVYLLSATRTPIGSFLGGLKTLSAPDLGAITLKATLERSEIPKEKIDECLMGCVLTGGLGQAPARQAALKAGLPTSVRATTVQRVCGSGLKAVGLAMQAIQTEDAEAILAGGMESMSRAPYLLDRAREGFRYGHGSITDSLLWDGLTDAYQKVPMGDFAELCAREKKFSREDQDRFALESFARAKKAIEGGLFSDEVIPVEIEGGKEKISVARDEGPFKANLDKLKTLKPAFQKDGTVTAGNASQLSDGAASVAIASEGLVKGLKLQPIARLVAQAHFAQSPEWFTTAPVGAVEKLLEKAKLSVDDIDVFEINEAFAAVALACRSGLKIPDEKINPRGGAVALGHPIGASGARILTTLVHTLKSEKKRYGVAALCIGGGEATAVLVEAL